MRQHSIVKGVKRGGGAGSAQGGWVREAMRRVLQNATGVTYVQSGSVDSAECMQRSKFCLVPAGDTPSSSRLSAAMLAGCVPVIVSNDYELPFEGGLDYTRFAVIVPESLAVQPGYLVGALRGMEEEAWERLWRGTTQAARHFEYASPARTGGPEDMIWQAIARALSGEEKGVSYRKRRQEAMLQQLKRANVTEARPDAPPWHKSYWGPYF
eukprot:jgi/Mesen1/2556/ME000162S01686